MGAHERGCRGHGKELRASDGDKMVREGVRMTTTFRATSGVFVRATPQASLSG
jgi:hypothetical protein